MSDAPLVAERKTSKEFEKPAEGMYHAVISEIEDLGNVTRPGWQGAPPKTGHEIRIWWQLDAKDSEGRIFRVPERAMLLSLHEKANLFTFIKNLFGKEPPMSFDVRKLVGTERMVAIVHRPGKGENASKIYANVGTTMKVPANTPKLEIVPRPKKDAAAVPATQTSQATAQKSNAITQENPITDDDIPF